MSTSTIDFSKYEQKSSAPTIDFTKYEAAPTAQPRTTYDQWSDAAGEWWKQVNPVAGLKGLADAANHPIDTASNLLNAQGALAMKAKDALSKGNYVEAARHAANYMIPIIGPQTDAAGDLADKGELAKSAGMTAGIATNIAAPELMKGFNLKLPTGELSKQVYQSALKPSLSNSPSEIAGMVKTGLENKIPISPKGVTKLGTLITNLGDQVSDQIKAGGNAGATIDKSAVASRLGDTVKKFTNQVNPGADIKAIVDSRNEFMDSQPAQIPVTAAQALKQGTYQQLSSKAYGEISSASIEAQKALARGIKEELEQQFPEIKGLNARQGQALNLDEALQKAVQRINNRNLVSLGSKAAAAGGAAIGGTPGAAVSFVLHHIITSPEVQSELAFRLKNAGVSLPVAQARIAAYSNALGNATKDADPNGGADQ